MKIKDQLLEAVSNEDGKISEALTDIFESVELSESVRDKFSTVFESVIKAKAVELAESHIEESAAKAEELIEAHKAELNEAAEKYGEHLAETMQNKLDTYLDHVVDTWMTENKLAVESGLKVSMFDGLMEGMTNLFVENNVTCPDEKIDMVVELEEANTDLENRLLDVMSENRQHKDYAAYVEKTIVIDRATENMTESQKEKVVALSESIQFDEAFEDNLNTVIAFATGIKLTEKEEEKDAEDDKEKDSEKEADEKPAEKEEMKEAVENDSMSAYLKAARLNR